MQQSSQGGLGSSGDAFGHTRWSLVAALRSGEAPRTGNPLAELSRSYWYPVYAYLRRSGHEPGPAELLCRRFFARLASDIRRSNPSAFGRFRSFLFDRLQGFLAEAPQPVEGNLPQPPQPLEAIERRLREDLGADGAPASAFERGFGLQVLARSRERLQAEAERSGRARMFDCLAPFLTQEPQPSRLATLASELGIGNLALQVAIKRLRQRFRELVEAELAETVATPADLEAERAALLRALSQP